MMFTGIVPLFRKSPPNSINGIRRVGPKARAICTELAIQEIKYPKETTVWVSSSVIPMAIKNFSTSSLKGI